jgi:hypothetical protein
MAAFGKRREQISREVLSAAAKNTQLRMKDQDIHVL